MQKNILAYLALAAVCLIWGTTYLALRIGVTQFPPFLFSAIRFLVAGPMLLGILVLWKKPAMPLRVTIIHHAISGILMCAMGVGVVGWCEMYISSGLAAIICSVMPVWVILINIIVTAEDKPTFPIILGLVIGLAGIVLIFGEHVAEFSDSRYFLGIVLTFTSNLCWSFGTVWMKKKNKGSDPFLGAAIQMLSGGLFLTPMSLVLDDYSKVQWTSGTLGSLIYLILVGSVAAYVCYNYAIVKLPMTIASLYAYINPIVAVLLGWLILSEKLNFRIGMGILITIAGIYIVNRGYQLRELWRTQLERFKV